MVRLLRTDPVKDLPNAKVLDVTRGMAAELTMSPFTARWYWRSIAGRHGGRKYIWYSERDCYRDCKRYRSMEKRCNSPERIMMC